MAQSPMIQKINREQSARDLNDFINDVVGPAIMLVVGFLALVYAPVWMPMVKMALHNITA